MAYTHEVAFVEWESYEAEHELRDGHAAVVDGSGSRAGSGEMPAWDRTQHPSASVPASADAVHPGGELDTPCSEPLGWTQHWKDTHPNLPEFPWEAIGCAQPGRDLRADTTTGRPAQVVTTESARAEGGTTGRVSIPRAIL